MEALRHPGEMYNLLRFRLGGRRAVLAKLELDSMSDSLRTCYRHLDQTSRTFAVAIQALEGELRDAICIYYLVLRAMDTMEDDMTISLETKLPILQNFHTYLYQADWRFTESKDKSRQVLEDFPTISLAFRSLPASYQEIIADACHKAGLGMVEFLEKKVDSLQDLDKYCYYVTGLAGISFHRSVSASGLEDGVIVEDKSLLNSWVFVQKINVIRDYLEDQLEGREFWPKEVWSKYATKLSDLAKPENIVLAVQCLNELVTNALQHLPDVLLYLSQIRNQSVFKSCAIPQVLAIATLAACYNNPQVFKGVVKVRKGQAVTLMMDATNMQAVRAIVYQYLNEICQKIPLGDPSAAPAQKIVSTVQRLCLSSGPLLSRHRIWPINVSCAMLLVALSWQFLRTV